MVSQQMENGGFNSSFLVLNLGSNTLGLGNSSMIPVLSEAAHDNLTENNQSLNAVDTSIVVSSSTDDTSSQSRSRKSKRPSKGSDDPDWLPERRAKRSNSVSSMATKQKPGPAIVDNIPPEASSEGGISLFNFTSGTPPQYLVNLLNFFGWKVVRQPGFSDYVYISPSGVSYYSLSKAFETFLHGTSKYKDKPWVTLQYDENMAGKSLRTLPPQGSLARPQGLIIGSSTDGRQKEENNSGIRNLTVHDMATSKPSKRTPEQEIGAACENANNGLSRPPSLMISQGLNQFLPSSQLNENIPVSHGCSNARSKQVSSIDILSIGSDQPCDGDTHEYEKLSEARRSRHVPGASELDIQGTDNISFHNVSGNETMDENLRNATSQAKSEIHMMPEGCSIEETPIVTKSGCTSANAAEISQGWQTGAERDKTKVRARRSRRTSGKNVLMDGNIAVEIGWKSPTSPKSFATMPTCKADWNLCVSENSFDVNANSPMRQKDFGSIEKKWHNSMTPLSKNDNGRTVPSDYVPGIRRSTRINGKHVHVDDESDIEIEVDDEFFNMSNFADERVLKDKKILGASFSEFGFTEGKSIMQDGKQMKLAIPKESVSVKQVVDCNFMKYENAKRPGSERFTEVKVPVADGLLPSSSAKRKQTSGRDLRAKEKKQRSRRLVVRRNGKEDNNEGVSSRRRLTLLSWLLDSGVISENDKVLYISKSKEGHIPCGLVTRDGVWCDCCKKLMPLSQFGAHSDSQPNVSWDNMYLISGKTLTQCLEETWKKEKNSNKVGYLSVRTNGPDASDDTCGICADGGHLICCDGCPSTFHQECLKLRDLPKGTWYCPYCRCAFCMVAEPARDDTLLACKQCSCKYHQKCAGESNTHEDQMPFLFCGKKCKKLAARLSEMIGVKNPIEEGFSWTLLKCVDNDENVSSVDQLSLNLECKVKLSMALYVLNECFIPLVDQRTGVDMLCQAVYNQGSNFNRLSYEGFYTLILEKDEEIVSVASVRFMGTKIAEMPFVGTRPLYQRQGMCRRLIKAVEDLLSSLCIQKLVIPAIPDLLETWMTSFSFRPLESSVKDEIRNLSMVTFGETILLQKSICNSEVVAREDDNAKAHFGKEIQNNYNLQLISSEPSASVLKDSAYKGFWNHENAEGPTDVTPDPRRIGIDSSFNPDFFGVPSSELYHGTVLQGLPRQNMTMPDQDVLQQSVASLTSFPTTSMVQHNDPLGGGLSLMSNSQTNMCSPNGYELNTMQKYAIDCTLSFDKLLKMAG